MLYEANWIELEDALIVYIYFFSSVYDGHEHGLFMEKLDARIRNHDREIEKMCNHHFQGFVDSITELLKVRGEAQKLKVRTDVEIRLLVLRTLLLPHLTFPSRARSSTPTGIFRMTAKM